jgi:hypothetical protein
MPQQKLTSMARRGGRHKSRQVPVWQDAWLLYLVGEAAQSGTEHNADLWNQVRFFPNGCYGSHCFFLHFLCLQSKNQLI